MRPRHAFALALLAASGVARVEAADLNVITGVEVKDEGGTVVLQVRGSKPPNFTTFSMADPPRFVLDLSEAKFQGVPEDVPVNDGTIILVKNLSYGSDATSIARVMIAFAVDVEPPDVQASGNDLVVRVAKPAGAAVAAAPTEKAREDAEAQAKAKAEAERRAEAEAEARAEADRKAQEAEAQARAEADRKAQEAEAQARAEAERKEQEAAGAAAAAAAAELTAEQARQEEARRAAEDEERQRQQAMAAAQAEDERKQLEAREAEKQAEEQARLAGEAEAARAAKEAEDQRVEAERLARAAAGEEVGRASASESQLAAPAPRTQLREVGFRQMPGVSRVFVRTSVPPAFTIQEVGEDTVRVELQNTNAKRRNDTRFLDTSFFPSAVAMISPSMRGSTYVVDIKLKERVPYQQRIEGDMLAIDFERPASAPAPGAEPPAAAAEPPADTAEPPAEDEETPAEEVAPPEGEPQR